MLDALLRHNLLPAWLMRLGIHYQLHQRLNVEKQQHQKMQGEGKRKFIESLKQSAVALSTKTANEQHYEIPTAFYQLILGKHLKYSCGYFVGTHSLNEAEENMLTLTCERAEIQDGQSVLDLGCGWGSLSLFIAQRYPACHITAISNSTTQKSYIEKQIKARQLNNLNVITSDVNTLSLSQQFDRVVSVEMFEHVRNYQQLMQRIAKWLVPNGKLFVHHFCHRYLVYPFNADNSWMARHFFTDGLMPSEDLLLFFQKDLTVESRWQVSGNHYSQTCKAWLMNLFCHKNEIMSLFKQHYGKKNVRLYFHYWQLFIRACQQLFAYNKGEEWFVTHYRFKNNNESE